MASAGTGEQGELMFADFLPKNINENECESFNNLIYKANQWLTDHVEFKVVSCETIIFYDVRDMKYIESNRSDFHIDLDSFKGGTIHGFAVQALRVWYKRRPEDRATEIELLYCVNISPRIWKEGSLFNKKVFSEPLNVAIQWFNKRSKVIPENILNVQTCTYWLDTKESGPDQTRFHTSASRHQVRFLRIFCKKKPFAEPEERGDRSSYAIAFMDFHPTVMMKDIFTQAQEWIQESQNTPGTKILNVETVTSLVHKFPAKKLPEKASSINHVINFIRVHFATHVERTGMQDVPQYSISPCLQTMYPKYIPDSFQKYEYIRETLGRLNLSASRAVVQDRILGVQTVPVPIKKKRNRYHELGYQAVPIPVKKRIHPDTDNMHYSVKFIPGPWVYTVQVFWNQWEISDGFY